VPLYVGGDTTSPHISLALLGAGRFPRLAFDVPEVLLPPVSRAAPAASQQVCSAWVPKVDGSGHALTRHRSVPTPARRSRWACGRRRCSGW
jgi:hypothetical protein